MASFDKVIPPGQEGTVKLTVRTKYMHGPFSKSATIHSNDPRSPSQKITITGTVKNYVTIKPSKHIYLVGFEGDMLSKHLTIINNEQKPLNITGIETSLADKITWNLKTIEEGHKYDLKIATKENLKGSSVGTIILHTTLEREPNISIKVSIIMKDELSVSTSTLFFGSIYLSEDGKTPHSKTSLSRHLYLRKERGDPFKIEKIVPSNNLIKADLKVQEEGRKYMITVSLDKNKLIRGKF